MSKIKMDVFDIDWSSIVYYDEDSPSCLKWAVTRGPKAQANGIAGGWNGKGYCSIQLNKRNYSAKLIVWYLHYGPLKEGQVLECINGDKKDLRISNLRITTSRELGIKYRSTFGEDPNANIWKRGNRYWITHRLYNSTRFLLSCGSLEEAKGMRDVLIPTYHKIRWM